MKKNVVGLFLAGSCVMFVVGCASNEMVKKEEPLAPVTLAKAEPVKVKPSNDQSLSQAPVMKSTVHDALIPTQKAGELKAALEKVYFNFDSYTLSSEARNSLQKNGEILKNDSKVVVQIEGNCDERGSTEYNLALGEKRAKAAMQYLVTMGIPSERLSVISYGKERPVVQGADESAWSKNRRDEFVIRN